MLERFKSHQPSAVAVSMELAEVMQTPAADPVFAVTAELPPRIARGKARKNNLRLLSRTTTIEYGY